MATIEQLDAFIQQLKSHDYSYDYSDDNSVWRRGTNERDAILAVLKQHPELKPIHNAFYTYWWSKGDWEAREAARDQAIAAFRNSMTEAA